MTHRSHEAWTPTEERDLIARFKGGEYPGDLAKSIGRTELAVRARLAKFHLLPSVTAEDIEKYRTIRHSVAEPELETKSASPSELQSSKPEGEEEKDRFVATFDVQQAFHRFHFVYAIVNPSGSIYVGYTQDVWHRISQHNRDLGAIQTRNCGPWFPFAIYCFAAEIDARSMELQIHRSFHDFALRVEKSLREVLAQIGVAIRSDQLALI